jgi:hypothetical protein
VQRRRRVLFAFALRPREAQRDRPRERGRDQKSTSAVDALDVFATLSHLFVNFGGNIPEFLNHRAVWFRSQVGTVPASLTSPSRDVIEPAKDDWLDMAASATELEEMLIKHADGHHNSPEFCRCRHNLGYCRLKSRVGRSALDRLTAAAS